MIFTKGQMTHMRTQLTLTFASFDQFRLLNEHYSNDVLRTIMVKAIGLMLVFSNIQFAGIVVTLDSTPPSPFVRWDCEQYISMGYKRKCRIYLWTKWNCQWATLSCSSTVTYSAWYNCKIVVLPTNLGFEGMWRTENILEVYWKWEINLCCVRPHRGFRANLLEEHNITWPGKYNYRSAPNWGRMWV